MNINKILTIISRSTRENNFVRCSKIKPFQSNEIFQYKSILYIEVSQVWNFAKENEFHSLKNNFVLTNSAEPDEMPHYAAFHLSLYSLPRYLFFPPLNQRDCVTLKLQNSSIKYFPCRSFSLCFILIQGFWSTAPSTLKSNYLPLFFHPISLPINFIDHESSNHYVFQSLSVKFMNANINGKYDNLITLECQIQNQQASFFTY